MKKLLVLLLLSAFVPFVSAADKKAPAAQKKASSKKKSTITTVEAPKKAAKKPSIQVWLSRMKKKVARVESKHNRLVAVAAVRGDDAADAPPLYWKGKTAQGPVALPELKEFDDAINAALNGDNAGAKTKLEGFISAHPTSPLTGEARETLNLLGEETIQP